MADNKLYDYLDTIGLQKLAKGILVQVNSRITERIDTNISASSDDEHVASAAAVWRAIASSQHIKIRTWIGDINDIPMEERSSSVMYFQKDDEQDPSWTTYIWDEDNQEFIAVGTSDIDLSDYWRKDDTEDLRADLGIPAIESDVADIKSDIVGINDAISTINTNIDGINEELEKKVNKEDLEAIPTETIKDILDYAYEITDPFKYQEAATIAEVTSAIEDAVAAGETEIAIKITEDIDLTSSAVKSIVVPAGVELELNLDDATVTATDNAIKVSAGSTLKLVGDGTIVATTKNAKAAITAENGSTVELSGVTIDCTTQGKDENYCYGIYMKNQSSIVMNGGIIKTKMASCISTNNTTGGSDITINGGELYSDGSYAIYMPAQGTVNINGNSKVQGIIARMGTINVNDEAKIIPVTIDAETCEPLGPNISASGSTGLGDNICLIAGSYTDPNGIDIEVNIGANASVEANFRSAIGVYLYDTKQACNVAINVADGNNVSTTDTDFDAIKVYDHEYIAAAASEAGKAYNPVGTSTVTLNVQ